MTTFSSRRHPRVRFLSFIQVGGKEEAMNGLFWRWSKELRRRSIILGLVGVVLLVAGGLLALLIVDTVIL